MPELLLPVREALAESNLPFSVDLIIHRRRCACRYVLWCGRESP